MLIMKKLLIFFVLMLSVTLGANAQGVKKVVADKIVAQVGDNIILSSDISNTILDYKRNNTPTVPSECDVLEMQLMQKALVLQAEKDSLPISDDDIDARIDNQIRGFIREYGSREVLEEIAGKTIYQIKEDYRPVFREKILADEMREKILENVKISPIEVESYFKNIPQDSLPFFETKIEVGQIIVHPKANKDVEEYVIKQLYAYKKEVESGNKKFEELAKLYSQDPGSRDNGGQYNINRSDKSWDPDFMAAAFKLKDGQISPVVRSKFGFHIIQMVSKNGDDAVIRHILVIPGITDNEIHDGVLRLDSVRNFINNKDISFGEAVNKFSDDDNSKYSGGFLQGRDGSASITYDQITDKDLLLALKDMNPGDISQPQAFLDEKGQRAVRLIYLKSRTSPHRENLKEDYNAIALQALEEKKQKAMQIWFHQHIPTFYLSVDKHYEGCPVLKEWVKYTSNN